MSLTVDTQDQFVAAAAKPNHGPTLPWQLHVWIGTDPVSRSSYTISGRIRDLTSTNDLPGLLAAIDQSVTRFDIDLASGAFEPRWSFAGQEISGRVLTTIDGRWAVAVEAGGALRFLDARHGGEARLLDWSGRGPARRLSLSPDGQTIALGAPRRHVAILDLDAVR